MPSRAGRIADALLSQAITLARLEAGEQARVAQVLAPVWHQLQVELALQDPTAPPTLAGRLRRVAALVTLATRLTNEAFGTLATTHAAVRQALARWTVQATTAALTALQEVALVARELSATALTKIAETTLILGASARDWWARQAATIQRALGDKWRQALMQEQPLAMLKAELAAVHQTATRATDTLVRTSLASIFQATVGALAAVNGRRMSALVWHTTLDNRVCLQCIALSGQSWTIDHVPLAGSGLWPGEPPLHANCVTGDTLVTPGGRVLATSKRWYDGEMVIFKTSGGKQLTCTPNHPVLTRRGWVAAGILQPGDDVICGSREQRIGLVDMNVQEMPSLMKDIVAAFRLSPGMVASEVPVSAPDFHGDGEGSQIAIIGTNSLLRNRGNAAFCEHGSEELLSGRAGMRKSLLFDDGTLTEFTPASGLSPDSFMRGMGLLSPLFSTHLAPFEDFSCMLPSWHDAMREQAVSNDRPRDLVTSSKAFLRHPSLIKTEQFLYREFDEHTTMGSDALFPQSASDHIQADLVALSKSRLGGAFAIQSEHLVNVNRQYFSGHVFNLETELGWYSSNNIITHNCRCVLSPLPVGEAPAQDQPFETWLRTQPVDEQRAILGAGRFTLWQAGKIRLTQLVDQRHRPLTLEALRSESAA